MAQVIDLIEAEGEYPLALDFALTNLSDEHVGFAGVLEYALRVEYLRRDGKLVAPRRAGACCVGTNSSEQCSCPPPHRVLLAPGRTVKCSEKYLAFTYCDHVGGESIVEYRP